MGGLHLEQAGLVCIGQMIIGSGMDRIVSSASLDTVGLMTALCDVNKNDNLMLQWTSNVDGNLQIAVAVCNCRTAKCKKCKCAKNHLQCLTYCKCTRKCQEQL